MGIKERRKRRWPKMVGFGLLGFIVVLGICGGIFYWELQPKNHFNKVPVLAGSNASGADQSGVFNVLVLGVDTSNPQEPARTDSIMLVHVNLVDHKYDVLSIPRDTRVYLPGYGETKITHANYLGEINGGNVKKGALDTIQAVSELTGLPINYYAETSFSGLKDIVDAVGGVDMYIPFSVRLQPSLQVPGEPTVLDKGYHHLNGQMVVNLSRERMTLQEGDFARQQLQEQALIALAKKICRPSEAPNLPNVISKLSGFLVDTNMSYQDMISLALGASGFSSDQVHYYQVPGESGYFHDPVVGTQLYYWVPDKVKLNQIIQEHFKA